MADMYENVLLLTRNAPVGQEILDHFKRWGVNEITWFQDPSEIRFGESRFNRFTTVFVDEVFCGNARDTAVIVRKIRKEYFNPLVGFSDFMTSEGLLPLQVAGCNFIQYNVSNEPLVTILMDIARELSREHHHRL